MSSSYSEGLNDYNDHQRQQELREAAEDREALAMGLELVAMLREHEIPVSKIYTETHELVETEKRKPGLFGKKYIDRENIRTPHLMGEGWIIMNTVMTGTRYGHSLFHNTGINTDGRVFHTSFNNAPVPGGTIVGDYRIEKGSWALFVLRNPDCYRTVETLLSTGQYR